MMVIMTTVDKHFDMAKKPIRLGDIVAYAGGGYYTGIHLGRVIRLCDKQAVMMEAKFESKVRVDQNGEYIRENGKYVYEPGAWILHEVYVKKCDQALVIANPAATIPVEVFVLFENLEITGKRPKPEKKKK